MHKKFGWKRAVLCVLSIADGCTAVFLNTVYAPHGAVSLPYNDSIRRLPIHTQNIIIHNGQGGAFLQAARDAVYPDSTYTIVETNCPEVRKVLSFMAADSLTLLCRSAATGGVLFIVILYLYARSWQKENAICITSCMDFSAVRVGAFSEEGMTIGAGTFGMALGLTAAALLLLAAIQSIFTPGKKVRDCLFD